MTHKLSFYAILYFCCLQTIRLDAQTFYDMATIQEIRITFSQANWDYILDTMRQNNSTNKLLAQSVDINGSVYDSVGISYKGNSSYNPNNLKNPFHLELDYVIDGQDYEGYNNIKLSNVSHDPSFLREVLSYEILRNYLPSPQANYARVYVNGTYHGLYVNVETVNDDFVKQHFYSKDNPLFICDKPDEYTGSTPAPNLAVIGADSTAYYNAYDLKSDYGWSALSNLCQTLNNNTTQVENVLDVDRALWMLAYNNLFVNLDSYTGSIGHNYYIYSDNNHRFNTIVWDLNESFGRFTNAGTGPQLSFTQMQQLDPLLHLTNANKPLIQKLLADQSNRKKYIAHLRTMLDEMITTGWYQTRGQALQTAIAPDVQADVNKFFSYSNFTANLTTNITAGGGPGGGNIIGLTSLMEARRTYLQTNAEMTKIPPTISNIQTTPSNPTLGETVNITANVTTPTAVWLGYRYAPSERFVRIQMFDDGMHNDGTANNGVYGAQVPANISSALIQYYIYAEDADAGIFSPQRAEYEFHQLWFLSPVQTGQVVINEFLASNVNGMTDEAAQHDDWIELHNTTNTTQSMVGLYLSDDPLSLNEWALPDTSIEAGQYLIIWADNDPTQGKMHANFKLSKAGNAVYLSKTNGTILDSNTFGVQADDITTGRYPNGTGTFSNLPPTFASKNVLNVCPTQPTITGSTQSCWNGNTTYSVPPTIGATFFWNISGDGYIVSGQGTNQITVHWNTGATGIVNVVQVNP